MYDYIKMDINNQDFANELLKNTLLEFVSPVIINTGEIKDDGQTAKFKNLTFKVNASGRVEIKGSLHKYWNNGEHNYNDYNLNAVRHTIADLQQKFKIDPQLAHLHNLEVGLNIITPFKPNDLLDSLIAFKNSSFNKMRTKGIGMGKEIYFQQFGIKFYNKGLQFFRPCNILRFEKKHLKMTCLGWGHIFLSDLLSSDFATHCIDELLKCFDEIIITERVNNAQLSKNKNQIYDHCNNPLNWEKMSRNKRCKYKKQFTEIIQLYGQKHYKITIQELLLNKGHELIKYS